MAILKVRPAKSADRMELAKMRALLWPDTSVEEHLKELDTALSTLPTATLVAHYEDGGPIGFLEVGLRSHADGCNPARPVGYVKAGSFTAFPQMPVAAH
jgi:aminoglycoside 6'-N-acetyltransferase I